MHAASVHPEPGSNSLIYCIGAYLSITIFLSGLFLEPFGSCSLTCKSLFIFFKRIFGVFFVSVSLQTPLSLLFNFQGARCLTGQLVYYITPLPLCQYLFLSFLSFFYFLCISYNSYPFISISLYALVTFKYSSRHNPLSATLFATASPRYLTCHGSYIYPVISSFSLG